MKLTNSQEEYLKTIYLLSKNNEKVRVTDIAKKLKITKPSVNKGINNLKEIGILEYEAYGEIVLTKKGTELAEKIIKKQDILEMFLVNVLEIEKKKAVEEAKALKYAISEETAQKLKQYITEVLHLEELECGYDINNEKCRNCLRVTARNRIKKVKDID